MGARANTCTYTQTYTNTPTHRWNIHTQVSIYTHHKQKYIKTYPHTRYTHICMHGHVCTHSHKHTHTHNTHTHTHTHTHIHTHTHTTKSTVRGNEADAQTYLPCREAE